MKSNMIYAYGIHAAEAAITYAPEAITAIYADRERKGMIDTPEHLSVEYLPLEHLDNMVDGQTHQGVVVALSDFPYTAFADLDLQTTQALLVCEEIQDPHNLGAILRSAAAFGVDAVLIKKNRQVGVTTTVIQSSAGAAFQVPVIPIPNIRTIVEQCKQERFWVYGLTGDGTDIIWHETYPEQSLFIIGAEGAGLRQQTKELCDHLVSIPIQEVDSLNASVATAIMLYEWRRQRER